MYCMKRFDREPGVLSNLFFTLKNINNKKRRIKKKNYKRHPLLPPGSAHEVSLKLKCFGVKKKKNQPKIGDL